MMMPLLRTRPRILRIGSIVDLYELPGSMRGERVQAIITEDLEDDDYGAEVLYVPGNLKDLHVGDAVTFKGERVAVVLQEPPSGAAS